MEITRLGPSQFRLKTKMALVFLGNGVKIETKSGGVFEIFEPGEYEVEGVSVFGFGGRGVETIYLIQAEGLRVLYLANINKELTEGQIEELGNVDVVLAPAGMDPVLSPKSVIKMVEMIEPTFVLPYEAGAPVETLVAAYERGSREAPSLVLNQATMPTDITEVVVLTVK